MENGNDWNGNSSFGGNGSSSYNGQDANYSSLGQNGGGSSSNGQNGNSSPGGSKDQEWKEEITQTVKDLIEKCLIYYKTRGETVQIIRENYENIKPDFINLVWEQLEEDNPQFFHDYKVRLRMIELNAHFNELVELAWDCLEQLSLMPGPSNNSSATFSQLFDGGLGARNGKVMPLNLQPSQDGGDYTSNGHIQVSFQTNPAQENVQTSNANIHGSSLSSFVKGNLEPGNSLGANCNGGN